MLLLISGDWVEWSYEGEYHKLPRTKAVVLTVAVAIPLTVSADSSSYRSQFLQVILGMWTWKSSSPLVVIFYSVIFQKKTPEWLISLENVTQKTKPYWGNGMFSSIAVEPLLIHRDWCISKSDMTSAFSMVILQWDQMTKKKNPWFHHSVMVEVCVGQERAREAGLRAKGWLWVNQRKRK